MAPRPSRPNLASEYFPSVEPVRCSVTDVVAIASDPARQAEIATSTMGPLVVDLAGADRLDPSEVRAAAGVLTDWLGGAIAVLPKDGVAFEAVNPLLSAAAVTLAPTGGTVPADRRVHGAVDLAGELEATLDGFRSNPRAAGVFVQILRLTSALPVEDGVLAESFAYSTLLGGEEFATWLRRRGPARPAEPPGEPVLMNRVGDDVEIVLNHPQRRNAYSAAVRDALVEALLLPLIDEGIRRVRVRGNGPAFCSGGDLAEFGTVADTALAHLIRSSRSVGRLLRKLGARAEVHLHGACIGAGIEFPAFAARIVAAPDLVVRLPEIRMGLIPGAGGSVSITARIGRWRTAYLGLSGAAIGAPTAKAWGLVDEISAP